uniref:Histone H2A/H2B/H3 domain-containing protein n=1 Tax=Chromera velia CCMP2878 TaxID=1169474 RepID=A0A0G4HW60_9ALVE|eukprot:Cvel_32521.t1-p1 / transcript=Cvel_32521.t1 / gene=Cvel_32521 / organism=Chromera_velia_CCMP2878 / gene_product=Histone H2A.2, putative / transcript_product=Histone H2A.2, putative / location=Cvel_scaffold5080:1478-3049(+) / protein_length=524 / sequence_SO=supercontig / SO=protein_coding / is_pseudo=false
MLSREQIERVLALLDLALEEGWCRKDEADASRLWDMLAKKLNGIDREAGLQKEGGLSGAQLQGFFFDWEGEDVDVSYTVAYARAERFDGALLNVDLDLSPFAEEDFEEEEMEEGTEDNERREGPDEKERLEAASEKCRLEFPVATVAAMLDEVMEGEEEEEEMEEAGGDVEDEGAGESSDQQPRGPTTVSAMDTLTDQMKGVAVSGGEMETEGVNEVSDGAAVYMTSVLEYVAAEVLELSGNYCRDSKRPSIYSSDFLRAVKEDEALRKLFPDIDTLVVPTVPSVLSESLSSSPPAFRVDAYWRSHGKCPGGNLDCITLRYSFVFSANGEGGGSCRVLLDYHQNWDGTHYIGGGRLERVEFLAVSEDVGRRLQTALRDVILGGFVRDGMSTWHILDSTALDDNSYETEWSSVEVLVFAPPSPSSSSSSSEGEGWLSPECPFMSLKGARVLGPQYRPTPQYTPSLIVPIAPPQAAVVNLLTSCVGVGRPQEFSDGACQAAVDRRGLSSFKLPLGLPPVSPEYFRF